MDYRYTGDAHRRLHESYHADEEPFPTRTSATFPRREWGYEEATVLRELMFPGCWNADALLEDETAVRGRLTELGRCFHAGTRAYAAGNHGEAVADDADGAADADAEQAIAATVDEVLDRLPALRRVLKTDVEAAYKGDPAAKSYVEVVRSYPGFQAILVQRVAHALYEAGAAEYARELTEHAKSVTGIDIHPGATIGEHFFVDHGTGVVVGETATVGDWVRIYQDVTLGALHFEEEEDDEHVLKKGYKRHPDIGDRVVIGAGTKVLGAVSIGDHVSIGANSWVTESIPDHTSVYVSEHPTQERKRSE